MRFVRFRTLLAVFTGVLLWPALVSAQDQTGTITGRAMDAQTQRPLSGATIMIEGTQRGTITRTDGNFLLPGVPAGSYTVRASMIGFGSQEQQVTVGPGATATVQFTLQPQAVALDEVIVTGYGTQRREAITGSVAVVNADAANVGVITNPNEMIQGRVAGVQITPNNGEPGSGMQIRIRGGTSISASNEPLYVIDGVPVENVPTEARGIGISGTSAPLQRSPLALLNPSDIESISILKDASATAIYGSRAANGVVLITTKKGAPGRVTVEYDGYIASATAAGRLGVLSGAEYRAFRQRVTPDALGDLGTFDTNWEDELYRTGVTHNHNLSFTGGGETTQYRASLNYMDQQGVVINNGFERIQGRLNATHRTLEDRLRLGLNLNASQMNNNYLPFEDTGGFQGGVFTNMVIFNPTRPVVVADTIFGPGEQIDDIVFSFYEIGAGARAVRNPVALAHQIDDIGNSSRTLGSLTAAYDLVPGLTAQTIVGIDRSEGLRRTYLPRASPAGAEWEGRARHVNRDNSAITLQTFLTLNRQLAGVHGVDIVGGYEFAEYETGEFGAEGRGFSTDAFGFHNLGGGNVLERPFSWREEHRLVSFFGRANYSFADRYFLTGVLRRDGSSRFGAGNKWALFPAVSASWRISEEPFMADQGFFSDLRLRAGYGLQGNPGVSPYSSLMTLAPGGNYVFGESTVTGVVPNRNPNPNLKWEETSQLNLAIDYGFANNRFTGSAEYYVKNTSDLLLRVPVVQPAVQPTRLENVGSIRNRGVEFSLDAIAIANPTWNWRAGMVLAVERNEVVDLGGRDFINTGSVSGEGQSGQVAQRVMPGEPIGTFFGREFVRVNEQGAQVFRCDRQDTDCVNNETLTPRGEDFRVIGNANPDFTLGLRNQLDVGQFSLSFLVRSEVGGHVFNNNALVYGTKTTGGRNFLRMALDQPDAIGEPAIYSSRWIEDRTFVRLQNVTLGYTFDQPPFLAQLQGTRVYVSGDNLFLWSRYSGVDPEVHTNAVISDITVRGIDYLNYPRPRTITTGVRFTF
jgi:TonB-dependent starch-binding outer membrane protein SusC